MYSYARHPGSWLGESEKSCDQPIAEGTIRVVSIIKKVPMGRRDTFYVTFPFIFIALAGDL